MICHPKIECFGKLLGCLMSFWNKVKEHAKALLPEKATIGPGRAKPVLAAKQRAALKAKLSLYRKLCAAGHMDKHGFVEKCDALLFSSLARCAGMKVNVEAAESNGRWYRRPEKCCYNNGKDPKSKGPGSHSDISKDMYMGLLWATWHDKDRKRLERTIKYAVKKKFKVGRGPSGSTLLTPPLLNTMAIMLREMGGKPPSYLLKMPQHWPPGLKGYPAHLQVLHILLHFKIKGKITPNQLARLKEHKKRVPQNSLFSYAYHAVTDRKFNEAAKYLLKEEYFPKDRLPTKRDRHTDYLWQRDVGSDWKPNKRSKKEHAGIDFMFVAALILEEFE
jgi:hypothetical protein